ncbi:hypothetical protein ACFWWB_22880 [Streptomyces sp. NPDC058690]|uniref:hypothetical protein n=1 Tax=Streptomyces sp. NPDC058690 TaxID=3346600 RepID=UPI00365C9314
MSRVDLNPLASGLLLAVALPAGFLGSTSRNTVALALVEVPAGQGPSVVADDAMTSEVMLPVAGSMLKVPSRWYSTACALLENASTAASAANSIAQHVNSATGDLSCASRLFISMSPTGFRLRLGYAAGPGTRWVPGRCAVSGWC